MKNKLKIITLAGLLLIGSKLFAKSYVVQTKWFNIIYQEKSEAAAKILFESADSIYEEVGELYGIEPQFRMPIVICSNVEQFNAYWTSIPYNHIVIYDTAEAEDLSVFSETLKSTFRHEVTHAYTYNLKNKFWKTLGTIFGDPVNPGLLTVTRGWAEGAAVTSESENGEGRLNNEFSRHIVKQAKIEGKFPKYDDVQGARDKYKAGSFYNFNSEFDWWLQKKFGMEKYAEFWIRCVNLKSLTTRGAFKKVFGLSIKAAWKQFEQELEIPELDAAPNFEVLASNSLYTSLSVNSKSGRLAYIDAALDSVCLRERNGKIKKLFTLNGISDLQFSGNGKMLVLNYISQAGANPKAKIKLYDIETRRFYDVPGTNIRNGTIIEHAGKNLLVCQKYNSQNYSILIYDIEKKNQYELLTQTSATESPSNKENASVPMAFTAIKCSADWEISGVEESWKAAEFAYILKENGNYYLCARAVEGDSFVKIRFPEGIIPRYLSFDCNEKENANLIFSYVSKNTMPRLGAFNIQSQKFLLGEEDFDGGVFYPCVIDERLVYISEGYTSNSIKAARIEDFVVAEVEVKGGQKSEKMSPVEVESESFAEKKSENFVPASYNTIPYYFKGVWAPLSLYTNSANNYAPVGLSYGSSDPFSKNIVILTAGWNPVDEFFGSSIRYSSLTETALLNYDFSYNVEFDYSSWIEQYAQGTIGSYLPVGKIFYLKLADKMLFRTGKRIKNDYLLENIVSVMYGNVHKVSSGRFAKLGFEIGPKVGYKIDESAGFVEFLTNIYLPNVKTQFVLFPNVSNYAYTSSYGYTLFGSALFDIDAEYIIFNKEIQKAIPLLSAIYVNDFYISAGYCGSFIAGSFWKSGWYIPTVKDKSFYVDSVYLKAALELTPNFGSLANYEYKTSIFVKLHIPITKSDYDSFVFRYSLGIQQGF